MPAIRSITEGRTTSPFYVSSISVKSRYSPYNTNGVTVSSGYVNPTHLFVVPPPTMIVPSQAAALYDTPVGEYLTGIALDSLYYPETEAAKKTTKVAKSSKSRKGKARTNENEPQEAQKKKSSRSKRKDANYIPRPKNAFMIFRCELYQRTVQEAASAPIIASAPSESTATASSSSPSSSSKPSKIYQNEFSKRAAAEWNNLPLEERKIFESKAAEDKERINLLHLERKEVERAQRETDLQPVWQPEDYEVTNQELPLQREEQAFTTSTSHHVRAIEIIDLTQDDDDEICDNTASSSSQVFRSHTWLDSRATDNFGVDLSPRSNPASRFDETEVAPQLVNFSPSPVISSSEINFGASPQLHMPIPSVPIPSSISKFGFAATEYQNASNSEEFTQPQSYAYASSSSPSSSVYFGASNLPTLDTNAPSPITNSGPITPMSDSESIAKQLFTVMDLDLAADNQLPWSLQTGIEEWLGTGLPLEDVCSGSYLEVDVPALNVDQWCW